MKIKCIYRLEIINKIKINCICSSEIISKFKADIWKSITLKTSRRSIESKFHDQIGKSESIDFIQISCVIQIPLAQPEENVENANLIIVEILDNRSDKHLRLCQILRFHFTICHYLHVSPYLTLSLDSSFPLPPSVCKLYSKYVDTYTQRYMQLDIYIHRCIHKYIDR